MTQPTSRTERRATWHAVVRARCTVLLRPRWDDLRDLDERTLRDIGLARAEISSLEAELAGRAAPTRRRVTPLHRVVQA